MDETSIKPTDPGAHGQQHGVDAPSDTGVFPREIGARGHGKQFVDGLQVLVTHRLRLAPRENSSATSIEVAIAPSCVRLHAATGQRRWRDNLSEFM